MRAARPGALALIVGAALALLACGGGEEAESQRGTAPSPQAGSKTAAPGVPTSPQGDNSIQTWGVEASDVERGRLAAFVQGYLDARARGEWDEVCAKLAAEPRAEQSRLAGGAPCPEAMAAFAADANPATLEQEARIEVLSLRVGGGNAFLIYRRPDGVWSTALEREGGGWRVLTVTPTPLS